MELKPVFLDSESQKLDKFTIKELGFSPEVLMGMAATSIFEKYRELAKGKNIIILAGSGNNGGDGIALGVLFHCLGEEVKIYKKTGKHSQEYLFYLQKAQDLNIPIEGLESFLAYHPVPNKEIFIVDCLLGTGFKPPLTTDMSIFIQSVNVLYKNLNKTILSIDVPSGFNLEDPESDYIRADILAEVGCAKLVNLYSRCLVKEYSFHPISFPVKLFQQINPVKNFFCTPKTKTHLKQKQNRSPNSHKYSNGVACFLGGSEGMEGAILLSQKAFHSTGGGYSQVFSPSKFIRELGLRQDPSFIYNPLNFDCLKLEIWDKATAIVIGPGLKKEDLGLDVGFFLKKSSYLILDAGAIILAKGKTLSARTILTPHLGEFQKLIDKDLHSHIDVINELRECAVKMKAYILLKGHVSILASPEGQLYFFPFVNPKLSTMGTGDLLCGVLAFFLSKNTKIEEAVWDSLSYLYFSKDMEKNFPTAEEIRKYLEEY